ncbi:MAG: hypothetical protein LAQ69_46000 [Acidobacteriia bacterium]|nr:hypothetical protein [Terriglobia bacterium]
MPNGNDDDALAAAAADAIVHGPPKAVKACDKNQVSPVIAVAAPKIVMVKKGYQAQGHRLAVRLATNATFSGTGTLTITPGGVRLFDSKGGALPLPYANIPGAQLSKVITVYVEGVNPSGAMDGVHLSLALAGGDKTIVSSPATDTLTCVEVTLELGQYKANPGGGDPPPVGDKIGVGRNLHLQTDKYGAGRAMLTIEKAQPAAYPGDLVLKSRGGRVRTFARAGNEVAAAGQAEEADPLNTPNPWINPPGHKLWVEGSSASKDVLDTGFTLEISDLPGVEGDRANITVVDARLKVHQSRRKAGKVPKPVADGDKLNPGRFLHKQDAGNHHGRARTLVPQVKPKTFAGNLELVVWDVTANSAASPRMSLFTAEAPGGGALGNPHNFGHGTVPAAGLELWTEGQTTSGGLRDTQLRLRVADAEGTADRTAFTVAEFTKIDATVQPTPTLNPANGAAMTPAVAAPNPHTHSSTSYDDDFTANIPLVLMRNSQPDVALVLTAQPAGLPIVWDAPRNPADHTKLGSKKKKPVVTAGANVYHATLNANRKGSFRIRPYIDCNGAGIYSDGEPSIPMNLILFDAKIVKDRTAAHPKKAQAIITPGGTVAIKNGLWTAGLPGAGIAMDLEVIVTGGGADGRLGVEAPQYLYGGLINMTTALDIHADYVAAGPPVAPHTFSWALVSNKAAATTVPVTLAPGVVASMDIFLPGAVPTLLVQPLLDSGQTNAGTGGNTACMRSSSVTINPTNPPVGKRWTIQCMDSPGCTFPGKHPVPAYSAAQITGIFYDVGFRACFCLWTNVSGAEAVVDAAAVDAVANRLYTVIRIDDWRAWGEWTVSFPVAGAKLTVVTKHKIKVTKRKTISPMGRAQDNNVEVRPPTGIHNVTYDGR